MTNLSKNRKDKATVPFVLANEIIAELQNKELNGKSLFDVDGDSLLGDLQDITMTKSASNGSDGNPIRNLCLVYPNRKILFGLSKGFDDLLLEQSLGDCRFYIRRKMVDGDKPNEPSGAFIAVFGKPGGITVVEETSLLAAEPVAGK